MNSKVNTINNLASPLRLFFFLLLVIFGIELLIMFVLLPLLFDGAEGVVASIADSTLLTLLTAPYLWMRIVRPLRNVALQEAAWTKTILEHVVDGVVILDKTGIVGSVNIAAEKLFGYTISEAKGLEIKTLFPEGKSFYERNGGGNYRDSYETVGRHKNGSYFPMDLSISRVGEGEQCLFICIMRDITDRKRAEEKIRRLNEELEFKVEEKTRELLDVQEDLVRKEKLAILGQLSGSVGHELRNPLGVMSNAVYYLKMVHADADVTTREYLEMIQDEIDNSLRIITGMLDFARTTPPQRQSVSAGELVRQSLEKCSPPENVSVTVDLPDGLPRLNIDPPQIGQVLTNFITNGVQAMPDGGALHLAARCDGNFAKISVSDNGAGITAENMKKLFQPLFTTKAKGIGLGLVACKNLVEANDGRIEVESAPGKGTTFSVLLPIREEPARTAPGGRTAGEEPA